MSGFLRRLAAQANGSAESVRSSSRLPYATAPEPVQESWQSTHSSVATFEPEQPLPARISPAPATSSSVVERLADSPRLVIDEASTDAKREATDISLPAQLVNNQSAGRQTQDHPTTSPAPHASLTRSPDNPRIVTSTDSPPNPLPVTPEPVHMGEEPLHRVRSVTALLPPQPIRYADSSVRTERLPASGDLATAVEETTEVHVNIGRIEITAVHDAPTTKREPARTRSKPMTLEDYLAKRSGARP